MPTVPFVRRCVALRLLPFVAVVLVSTGCGDGTSRLSGKVTFGGKPIPAGKIYFLPDTAKGNSGPTGYAEIKDGTYDTKAAGGQGVGRGPMIVTIEGIDPAAPKEKKGTHGEESIKALFPRYETATELTGEPTKDFDVPADAGKPQPQGGRPRGP